MLEMLPLLLQVLLQQRIGTAVAQIPGCFGGHTTQVNRVKIAARGQHVSAAACWGP